MYTYAEEVIVEGYYGPRNDFYFIFYYFFYNFKNRTLFIKQTFKHLWMPEKIGGVGKLIEIRDVSFWKID